MPGYAAYCGLYCGACCSMITQEKAEGEESALEMITDETEQPCLGCNATPQQNCEFIVCNTTHGTENCAFCPEFPCLMLVKFNNDEWEHHRVVLENLKRIKEIGVEGWLKEQKEFWKCHSCGMRIQWYQKQCNRCGEELNHCI